MKRFAPEEPPSGPPSKLPRMQEEDEGDSDFGPPKPPPSPGPADQDEDDGQFGPPKPPPSPSPGTGSGDNEETKEKREQGDDDRDDDDDDEDDEEDDDDASDNPFNLPVSSCAVLGGASAHRGGVTALALDRPGSRLLTGGASDSLVRMWDFAGMNRTLQSFREVEPFAGNQVTGLAYSPAGDQVLVATGDPRAKVITREGVSVLETVRGDMYLSDITLTGGHVTGLTGCAWVPSQRSHFATASRDGTLRVWDCAKPNKNLKVVRIRAEPAPGGGVNRRNALTAMAYSPNAKMVAVAAEDGSLHVLACDGPAQIRPEHAVQGAHAAGQGAAGLVFSRDNWTLASRGDGSLRLWDVRKFREPTATFSGFPARGGASDVLLSPDEQLFVVVTSAAAAAEPVLAPGAPGADQGSSAAPGGEVVFVSRRSGQVVNRTPLGPGVSGTRLLWNSDINQLVVGCTDGATRVFYDPALSRRGVLLCADRRAVHKDPVLEFQPQAVDWDSWRHSGPRRAGAPQRPRK